MSKPMDHIVRQLGVLDELIKALEDAKQRAMNVIDPESPTWTDTAIMSQLIDRIESTQLTDTANDVAPVARS